MFDESIVIYPFNHSDPCGNLCRRWFPPRIGQCHPRSWKNNRPSNREVDVIGFTGSEQVGRELMKLSSESPVIKKCVLELGGKGAAIVMPDANIDIAATCQIAQWHAHGLPLWREQE